MNNDKCKVCNTELEAPNANYDEWHCCNCITNPHRRIKMKQYAVEVVEKYELRRTYCVEAKNKTEARKMAKNMEWDDAYDGWESDCDGDFGKWSENQLPELMSASVKGEVREEVK